VADGWDGLGRITAPMLRSTFDHWRIFERDGKWWAMRAGAAGAAGPQSLIRPVVFAVTLDGLAEQLSLQEWLRRMTAAELEAVWQGGLAAVPAPEALGGLLGGAPGAAS
jgi:hypothetical protein